MSHKIRLNLSDYPGIQRAALEIAYDNGMINREESEPEFLAKIESKLSDSIFSVFLSCWSDWLATLSVETLHTICCGEECEAGRLLDHAPHSEDLDRLLNFIFEENF